jgi:hypothetical protein
MLATPAVDANWLAMCPRTRTGRVCAWTTGTATERDRSSRPGSDCAAYSILVRSQSQHCAKGIQLISSATPNRPHVETQRIRSGSSAHMRHRARETQRRQALYILITTNRPAKPNTRTRVHMDIRTPLTIRSTTLLGVQVPTATVRT